MFDTIMPDEDNVTVDGVQKAVEAMSRYPDFYGNHDIEDELYKRLLEGIAAGRCSDPAACAKEALKTQEFPFPRYTA